MNTWHQSIKKAMALHLTSSYLRSSLSNVDAAVSIQISPRIRHQESLQPVIPLLNLILILNF